VQYILQSTVTVQALVNPYVCATIPDKGGF